MTDRKFNFIKKEINNLPSPASGKQVFYRDSQVNGLALSVSEAGTKSFVYYRKVKGRPYKQHLGHFPDMSIELARGKATELNSLLAQGVDFWQEKAEKKKELTFKELFDKYIEDYAMKHTKTWAETQANYGRHFQRWNNVKLSEITQGMVQDWFNNLAGEYIPIEKRYTHQDTANRNYDTMRAVITWGTKKNPPLFIGTNPCIGIKKFKTKPRERFMQPGDEFERFSASVSKEPNPMLRDFFWMCLLTGARKSNVMAMRWDQISIDLHRWNIPDTKNDDSHSVPLTTDAMAIIRRRNESKENSPWVFPSDGKTGHLVSPKTAWKRLLKRAGIENLRIHDLRRTAGSYMAIQGVSPTIIGKALGHKSLQATAVYARLTQDPVLQAMENAQAALSNPERLLKTRKDTVVEFDTAKAAK